MCARTDPNATGIGAVYFGRGGQKKMAETCAEFHTQTHTYRPIPISNGTLATRMTRLEDFFFSLENQDEKGLL